MSFGSVVEVVETAEAREQRLVADAKWLEAKCLAEAEHKVDEHYGRLVKPVLDQESIQFEGDGGPYRQLPKSDVELLREEVRSLNEKLDKNITNRQIVWWAVMVMSGVEIIQLVMKLLEKFW